MERGGLGVNKKKIRTKPPIRIVSMIASLFGPSGETRTRGILVPKYRQNLYIVYSVFLGRFSLIRLLSPSGAENAGAVCRDRRQCGL